MLPSAPSLQMAPCSMCVEARVIPGVDADGMSLGRRYLSWSTGFAPFRGMQPRHSTARSGRSRVKGSRRWSSRVTASSDALDLESGVFLESSANAVARSLKRSAEQSQRRNSEPYRSAMSMLTFFINRAGRNLSARRRQVLERAKDELRVLYGRASRTMERRRR